MSLKTIRTVYLVAGVYDMAAAVVFGLFFKAIYNSFGVELPNHDGYVQIAAIYIFVFGFGYYLVYKNPLEGLGLVIIGVLMKFGFCIVVFGHILFGHIPPMYIPFGFIDLVVRRGVSFDLRPIEEAQSGRCRLGQLIYAETVSSSPTLWDAASSGGPAGDESVGNTLCCAW